MYYLDYRGRFSGGADRGVKVDTAKFSDQTCGTGLERLYHEDHILYARMNNFSTVQAFLATALAFTTSATTTALNISLIVTLFGLALSLFYISLGFRGVRVIQFWRAYLRLLESMPGVTSIDSHLSEFYRLGHRRGPEETELPLAEGLAIKIETSWWARRSVHDQFPWYLPGFSGTMFIAVGIPMLTTSFWVLVLYALFYPHKDMRWFVLGLGAAWSRFSCCIFSLDD